MTEWKSQIRKDKKKKYTVNVYKEFPYPYGNTLKGYMEEIQSFLAASIPEEYHESLRVDISLGEDYGDPCLVSRCWYERPATEKEIAKEEEIEKAGEQRRLEHDLKVYEALKAKFEASSGKK